MTKQASVCLAFLSFRPEQAGGVFSQTDYHFVDCSYLLILLRYGVVTLLVLMLLWVLMACAAGRLRDRRMLLALAVIAVQCVSEHHYTEVNCNPFLILPFSLFLSAIEPTALMPAEQIPAHRKWAYTGILTAVAAVLTAVVILIFPWFTTLCTLYDLGGSYRHRAFLFLAVCASLIVLMLFAVCCTRFLSDVLEKKKPEKRLTVLTGFLAASLLCGLFAANSLIERGRTQQAENLEHLQPVVSVLQKVSGCRLYADDLPALYRRSFGRLDRSLFHGEDLAREKNLAVITDADRELNILIKRGFLYTEISENQAVYTDLPEVAEALRAAGYNPTGYYLRNRELDLNEVSWTAYGEGPEEEGIINLTAQGAIEHNVRKDLYGAAYKIIYDLKIVPENDRLPAPEDPVCTLRVIHYPGNTTAGERDVLFSEFDEEGSCRAELDISVPDVYWTEFLIAPKDGDYSLLLKGIHYQKIQP